MAEKQYLDYEGLNHLVTKFKKYVGDRGHIEFKGTVANVASLPNLADQNVGYMYTIQASGKTTADFTDGAGKTVSANSEVSAVKVSGTTENPLWSIDGGTSFVDAEKDAVAIEGTIGSATKVCDVYVADSSATHLTEGHWYVTEDGTSFYDATTLAGTFAEITKTAVDNEDAIAELGEKFTGSAFVELNTYIETVTGEVKKWCLLGPIFDVSDKLTFGTAMPSNPEDGDTFLYLGETSYTYATVTPEGTENPSAEGWYESDGEGGYVASADTEIDPGKTYYTRAEEYVKGVIYVWNDTDSEWVPQSSGDVMTPITNAEIDALID